MIPISRRKALIGLGLGSAGVCLQGFPIRPARARIMERNAARLAAHIIATPEKELFDFTAGLIGDGLNRETLLNATFLAGVQELQPRVSGPLHAVMVVASSFQLADASPERDRWLAPLWNLSFFKTSQMEDHQRGVWSLPPSPKVSFASEAQGRREFKDAMEAWDEARAERALVGWLPYGNTREIFEILWPMGARCFVNIGHKMIYPAQIHRVLTRVGWTHGEPVLRSLVRGLLYAKANKQVEAYHRSMTLARELPENWLLGKESPKQSMELMTTLRNATSHQAQQILIDAFKDGLGPTSIWDGLRLLATELFHRRPATKSPAERAALLSVHPVTVINAFHYGWRQTKREETRRLLILQAAGWMPLMRQALARIVDHQMAGNGLEHLGSSVSRDGENREALFHLRSPDKMRLHLDQSKGDDLWYLDRLRHHLLRKGVENHQFKYGAAMAEEAYLIHPQWRSRILAPAVNYLPGPEEELTRVHRLSRNTLIQAGLQPKD